MIKMRGNKTFLVMGHLLHQNHHHVMQIVLSVVPFHSLCSRLLKQGTNMTFLGNKMPLVPASHDAIGTGIGVT